MTARREWSAAAALHAALAAASFAPLWGAWQTAAFARTTYDLGINLWLQWWGPFALLRGHDPFFTHGLFYPAGTRLSVDANVPLWLMATPLAALWNTVGVFNALAAFSYAATGAASYALFRRFSDSRSGCLLASFAFAYSSYRGYALLSGYGEMLQTQWAVLLVLACVDHVRAERGAWPAVAASALAAALADPRTFLMAALMLAVGGAAVAWSGRDRARRMRLLGAGAIVVLCALPRLLDAPDGVGLTLGGGVSPRLASLSVGPRDLFIFPAHHALRALGAAGPGHGWPESASGYLSPVFLLFACWGLAASRGRPARALLAGLLALCALLSAARWPLASLPVLSFLRVPARFMFATTLVAGVFAAWGWEAATTSLSRAARGALLVACACLLLLETNPVFERPLTLWSREQRALDVLAAAAPGGVVDLPLDLLPGMGGQGDNGLALLRATRHAQPLVNGHLSVPGRAAHALARDADLQSLVACQTGRCEAVDDGLWRRLRRRLGVYYVIRSEAASASLDASLGRARVLRPLAADAGVQVFEIVPGEGP